MAWRKWLVRSLVFSVVCTLGAAGLMYSRLTDPAVVRCQVVHQLGIHFPGATIGLDTARMRVLGGVAVADLRFSRRDSQPDTDFLNVPNAIFYHDKEQLLDGRVAIRRIELIKPRLHVLRSADGRWNLTGLLGPIDPHEPIPTIVIKQGTVFIEDRVRFPHGPALELSDVTMTLINDPLSQGKFNITARSDLVGPVRVTGTWQRVSGEVDLLIQADTVQLVPPLLDRLCHVLPDPTHGVRALAGNAAVRLAVTHKPESTQPWHHDLHVHVSKGRLEHDQLPLPLEQITADLQCLDGQVRIQRLTGQAGTAGVQLSLESLSAECCQHPGPLEDKLRLLDFKLTGLQVCPELFDRLPANLQKVRAAFAPTGQVDLSVKLTRSAATWRKQTLVHAADLALTYDKFRYPLQHTHGTVDHVLTADGTDHMVIDLVGAASGRPVTIKGTVDGNGPTAGIELDIRGTDLPLNDQLQAALPEKPRKLAATFHARGQADLIAAIHRKQGRPDFQNEFFLHFHDATVCYEAFRYPVEHVNGILEIHPDQSWEFHDFTGSHKGCQIQTHGHGSPPGQDEHFEVSIQGTRLPLDAELESALQRGLQKVWRTYAPTGHIDFAARVNRTGSTEPEIAVTVSLRDVSALPEFFHYSLAGMTGTIRYAHHWACLSGIQCHHGSGRVSVGNGWVYCKPTGGFWAKLSDLQADPLVPDADLLHALPPVLRAACTRLELRDPLALATEMTIDQAPDSDKPVVYWDGSARLRQAHVKTGVDLEQVSGVVACRGTYDGHKLEYARGNLALDEVVLFGQPVRHIQARFEAAPPGESSRPDQPEILRLEGLKADLFGGELYGDIRLEFAPQQRYELNLTASGIHLEELGRQNPTAHAQVTGLATARLYLHGQGDDLRGLQGRGSVEVPNGKLYNLPLLLDLLKFLNLHAPDRTAFEEAHADFSIEGQRVHIQRLDLFGNAISLGGTGAMNLDGSDLQLDFYAVWGRIVGMLPPLLGKIPPAVSRRLWKIKMRGDVKKVTFQNEPVPLLVEPLKELLERLSRPRNGLTQSE